MRIFISAIILVLLSGCVATVSQSKLYWGNYSQTLYKTKTNPGNEATNTHLKELESIVSKSDEMGLKVPPGIYAEIGLVYMSKNKGGKANEFFAMETKEYPESKEFISILIAKHSK